jgi:hypothetical protein
MVLKFPILISTLVVAAGLAWADGAGPRLHALVDEPFQVGDRVFPPGSLTVKPLTAYHPGATLDEIWAGPECLGLWVAERLDRGRAMSEHDRVIFERNEAGRLVLVGYVLREAGGEAGLRPLGEPAEGDLRASR